jgi:hypothetical protein
VSAAACFMRESALVDMLFLEWGLLDFFFLISAQKPIARRSKKKTPRIFVLARVGAH